MSRFSRMSSPPRFRFLTSDTIELAIAKRKKYDEKRLEDGSKRSQAYLFTLWKHRFLQSLTHISYDERRKDLITIYNHNLSNVKNGWFVWTLNDASKSRFIWSHCNPDKQNASVWYWQDFMSSCDFRPQIESPSRFPY